MKTLAKIVAFVAFGLTLAVAAPAAPAQHRGGPEAGRREERREPRFERERGDRGERREFGRREHERARGHFEWVTRRVWHEGYTRCVEVPAEYVTRYDHCGRPYTVCVRPAHVEHVQVPGWYETVTERVWVNEYTTSRCGF